MSYEMMEALLVQKIARLRESEAMFARTLQSSGNGTKRSSLSTAHASMNAQILEVEQLLAAMDAAPLYPTASLPALLPVDSAQQMTQSVWM
jgi:hypothetical protein